MKIIALRLQNLNSLRGVHEILFEEPPLADTGLFAITGPTGAGKSTLLDALTLALYGYAPRFGRESPADIMARHTGQCYAEVDFRVGTREYRGRWDLWRANHRPNGKLQPPKMSLATLPDGDIIAEKLDHVRQQVAELTGLDYPRFLRSVLLAQGDFAAFLKADENERGELLEKITGTDLYTRLSRLAFEKEKEKRLHLEGLERNLDQSRLLPEEEVQRKREALETGLARLQALAEEKDRLTADGQWLERILTLRNQALQLDQEMEKAVAARENFAGQKLRYEKHLRAASFAPAYREARLLADREATLNRQLLELRQSLRALEAAADEAKAAEAAARQGLQKQMQEGVDKEPSLKEGDALYHERQQTGQQYQKLKTDWDHQKKQVAESIAQKAGIAARVADLARQRGKLQQFLTDNAGDECLEGDARSFESALGLLVEKDRRLRAVAKEGKAKAGEENLIERLLAENKSVLADYKKQLEWKERQIEAIRQDINAIISEQADASLESRLSQLGNQRVILSNQITFARHYVSTSQEIEKLNHELYRREQEAKALAADLEAVLGEHRQAQAEHTLLVRLCEADQKIMNLESARRQLEPGKPCPLCGSVHHPFAEDGYQPQLSENEQKRDRKWQEIGELEQKARELQDRMGFLKAFRDNSVQQLQTLSRDVVKAESEFEKFRREAGNPYQIGEPEKIQTLFRSVEDETTRLTALQQELRDKKNALEEHRRQRDELTDQYTSLHTQQQVNEEKLANLRKDRDRLRQDEASLGAEAAEIRAALEADIRPYGLTLPPPGAEGSWLEAVRVRAARYKQAQEKSRALETEGNDYQMQLARVEERLLQQEESARQREAEMNHVLGQGQQIKGRITELADKLGIPADDLRESPFAWERRRLAQALLDAQEAIDRAQGVVMKGENALAGRLGQLRETETQLAGTAREAAEKMAGLMAELTAAGFESLEAFTGSLLSPAEEAHLKAVREDIQKRINQIEGAVARNSKELVELTAQIRTDAPMEQISTQLAEVKAQEKELVASLAALRHDLKENDRILEQFAGLSRQIAEGRKEYHRWYTLSDLIGSASGDKFRKFAQGLALEQLVDLANDHLLRLNPRYQIGRTPGTDLGLEVVDRYQADNVRPVKSLSGGETFLVSLSLALGLSDMAGSKTRIESLFIDEGFGTLDNETLDTALSTLENLQATGKLIGIISHVDALKDRLTTQIQVIRQSGGVSRIRVGGLGE